MHKQSGPRGTHQDCWATPGLCAIVDFMLPGERRPVSVTSAGSSRLVENRYRGIAVQGDYPGGGEIERLHGAPVPDLGRRTTTLSYFDAAEPEYQSLIINNKHLLSLISLPCSKVYL
jgi:hypothetical protein